MRAITPIAILISVIFAQPLLAESAAPASASSREIRPGARMAVKGWDFLVGSLLQDGISEQEIDAVYSAQSFPAYTEIPFQLKPAESKNIYRGFHTRQRRAQAAKFLQDYSATLRAMENRFGVSPSLVAAILLVETGYGSYLGKELVIYRLSRLAGLAAPENLETNLKRLQKSGEKVTQEQVQDRAQYLFEMFYPEVLAAFELKRKHNIDLLTLKGSRAGAFGIPQFLPTTYFRFAVDGNGDGKVSLFDMEDAIFSVGNFFAGYGWKENLSDEEKKKVIWHYNHSEPYVDTILKLSKELKPN